MRIARRMRTNKQSVRNANFRTTAKLGQFKSKCAVTRTKFSKLIYNFFDFAVSLNFENFRFSKPFEQRSLPDAQTV